MDRNYNLCGHVVEQKSIYRSTFVQLPCWYISVRSDPQAIGCRADLCILMARESSSFQNTMAQRGGFPYPHKMYGWQNWVCFFFFCFLNEKTDPMYGQPNCVIIILL